MTIIRPWFLWVSLLFPILPRVADAETIKIGGSGAGLGILKVLANEYVQRQPNFTIEIVPSLGSSGGISAANAGAIDICISGRPLNSKESSYALKQQAFIDTPFIFVSTHPNPPSLGSSEVLKIYRGESARWPDGSPMRVILRPKSDAASLFLAENFPGMASALETARSRQEIPVAATDQDNMELANRLVGSLAGMTLVQFSTEPHKLQMVSFNESSPKVAELANPAYPLRYRLYLIFPAKTSTAIANFHAFLSSEEALKLIRNNGGFPIDAK